MEFCEERYILDVVWLRRKICPQTDGMQVLEVQSSRQSAEDYSVLVIFDISWCPQAMQIGSVMIG